MVTLSPVGLAAAPVANQVSFLATFKEKLCRCVCATSQVKKSMESLGLTIPSHVTHGDAAYLANMYYADLYPDPLKDEASCLRAAYKVANDPDGYEGMIFCRWTADAIGKAIKLDWEKFV